MWGVFCEFHKTRPHWYLWNITTMGFLLNEDWISGYLGVIGGLLAFVIGVSALVLQLALPSYLETLMRRRRMMSYTLMIMLVYLVMAIILIWIGPLNNSNTIGGIWVVLVNIGMTFTFVATVAYTYNQLRQINSSRIIESLLKECKNDLSLKGMFDDTLDTLIDIGGQSNAGFEKTRVLKALNALIIYVLDQYPNYQGEKLKPIIRGFEEILVGGGVQGSRDNFSFAAQTLRHTIQRLCASNGKFADSPDMETAMHVCGLLAVSALQHFPESAREFLETINAAETQDRKTYILASASLRQIGITALYRDYFGIGVDALQKMLFWDDSDFEAEAESTADLLGLMSHIWEKNQGGKQLVAGLLSGFSHRFTPSVADCLEMAVQYHFEQGNFDTHGYLLPMSDFLNGVVIEGQDF